MTRKPHEAPRPIHLSPLFSFLQGLTDMVISVMGTEADILAQKNPQRPAPVRNDLNNG